MGSGPPVVLSSVLSSRRLNASRRFPPEVSLFIIPSFMSLSPALSALVPSFLPYPHVVGSLPFLTHVLPTPPFAAFAFHLLPTCQILDPVFFPFTSTGVLPSEAGEELVLDPNCAPPVLDRKCTDLNAAFASPPSSPLRSLSSEIDFFRSFFLKTLVFFHGNP